MSYITRVTLIADTDDLTVDTPKKKVRVTAGSIPLKLPKVKGMKYLVGIGGNGADNAIDAIYGQEFADKGRWLHMIQADIYIGEQRRPVRFDESNIGSVKMINLSALNGALRTRVEDHFRNDPKRFGLPDESVKGNALKMGWMRRLLSANPVAALSVREIEGLEHLTCIAVDVEVRGLRVPVNFITEGATYTDMNCRTSDYVNPKMPKWIPLHDKDVHTMTAG